MKERKEPKNKEILNKTNHIHTHIFHSKQMKDLIILNEK